MAIVVHRDRADALTLEDVRRIYLRQRRFWNDGAPIVALNREAASAVRERFSRRVLRIDTAQIQAFWNDRYFEGVFPPPVLSSSAAVKRYVAAERNAIGYLEWSEVDDSVRVALKLE